MKQSARFRAWFASLADKRAATKIAQRLVRLQAGLFGDAKPVGGGVSEIRIDHGPEYRIYFMRKDATVIVLLCGDDKGSQRRDIALAKALAEGL